MKKTNEKSTDEPIVEDVKVDDELSDKTDTKKYLNQILDKINQNNHAKKLFKELEKLVDDFSLEEILENDLKLQEEIVQARKERDEYLDLLQRFKADFENYKKRAQKQEDNNVRISSERIIARIFDPFEDISRAIKFAEDNKSETVPLDGITIIYNKLLRIMEDEGLVFIDPKHGESFDPKYHEAVCLDESGNHEPNKIVQKFDKGYKIKEKVVKAAKVMVSSEREEKIEEEEEQTKKED